MSGDIGFDIQGIEKLAARIDRISRKGMYQEVSEKVALWVRDMLKKYPSKTNRPTRRQVYGTPFKTDKQRRWFFWALGQGIISVPYRRTYKLRKGWKLQASGRAVATPGGARFISQSTGRFMSAGDVARTFIVNLVDYARWVQDEGSQSLYMRAKGWKAAQAIARTVPVAVVREKSLQVIRKYTRR